MDRHRPNSPAVAGGRTIESRLREIEGLWEGDLVSEAERNEARARVLHEI
jgi:hypothetical protein